MLSPVREDRLEHPLTTLYVHLDDRILPTLGFSRAHIPGRIPALNDAELLCLIVAQHLPRGRVSTTREF